MKNSLLNSLLSYFLAIFLLILVSFQAHPSLKPSSTASFKKEKNSLENLEPQKTLDFFAGNLNLKAIPFKNLLKEEKTFSQKKPPKTFLKERLKPSFPSKINLPAQISAQAALAIEPKTNFVFFEKNSLKTLPLASITKLMTAYVALKYFPENLILEVPEGIEKIETSKGKLDPKDKFYLKDLIYLMLLVSSNQAAYTLQKDLTLVPLMNLEAKRLGLKQTFFEDASGLSEKNVSSAKDIATLAYFLLKQKPEIFEIEKTKEIKITSFKGKVYHLKNNHPFINFPNFLGGKTGTLSLSFQNLVSIFKIKGKVIVIVVLGSKDRFKDSQKILTQILKEN